MRSSFFRSSFSSRYRSWSNDSTNFVETRGILPYEYRRVNVRAQKPPASVFGLRLRQARFHAGLPQDKLGVAIGLDEATASARISRYETGVHAAPYDVAAKMAQVLRVPTPFLFCEDDDLARLILLWAGLSKGDQHRLLAEWSPA